MTKEKQEKMRAAILMMAEVLDNKNLERMARDIEASRLPSALFSSAFEALLTYNDPTESIRMMSSMLQQMISAMTPEERKTLGIDFTTVGNGVPS